MLLPNSKQYFKGFVRLVCVYLNAVHGDFTEPFVGNKSTNECCEYKASNESDAREFIFSKYSIGISIKVATDKNLKNKEIQNCLKIHEHYS